MNQKLLFIHPELLFNFDLRRQLRHFPMGVELAGTHNIYSCIIFMSNRTQLMKAFSSLQPISEVYSSQSMHIASKIDYTGLIKRDAGLLTVWSNRNFTLRIGDSQRAELLILKNQATVEEVLFLTQLKITKKCTVIEDKPCFGIVMDDKKKYLFSLKNIHECQKFHAELTHVKKMEKQLVELYNSKRQNAVNNKEKSQQKEKNKKETNQIIETNQESEEMSESQESERIHRRYRNRQLGFDSMDSNEDDIFQTNFREVSTSVQIENQGSVIQQMQKFFDTNQNTLLTSHFGFTPYPASQRQKFFVNKQSFAKTTFIIKTSASIHNCIKFFLSFSLWNQHIKKSHNLSNTQNGPITYLQFTKGLTTTHPRCVIGEVNLLQNEIGASLRVRSVKRANYEYLSQKREVKMELLVKMVTDRSNKLQKVMTVALRIQPSKEEFELAVKFLRAIKDYQQKCKKLI